MYNSIFCCALMYVIERPLRFPSGMNKVLCSVMLCYVKKTELPREVLLYMELLAGKNAFRAPIAGDL